MRAARHPTYNGDALVFATSFPLLISTCHFNGTHLALASRCHAWIWKQQYSRTSVESFMSFDIDQGGATKLVGRSSDTKVETSLSSGDNQGVDVTAVVYLLYRGWPVQTHG
ncbi:hypothetical protein ONS95_010060 [Cadophora gregata]|uniref:uncharacterized protein n=1 Tax=Cadophora gregata TaxID=51156 RepID=UPI0026DB2552|nr:uncharacterized protein ONS95_010060 [Cadophora gregata]KAK0121777.1 hypothetical protein ONS95_010060 [Cadophora gregata]KAK0127252.1 hypothetical protein ONS96_006803 [Cadophora gregata f. sp. sojae]